MERPINILIVDDEPRNLTVLETVLNDSAYHLVRAGSADQALLALVAEEFALLILDIRMPGMNGFELAQIIKERRKTARVPIIFLTAYYNEDQHVLEGYDTGAVDYLHKPVNPAILRSKVAVFAELHRTQRECNLTNRALLTEVTQRRGAEEQLRELNETLEQRVTERTEALRASEERLSGILRQSPAGIVQTDASGNMTLVNARWCEMLGYTEAELLGKNVLEVTHASNREAMAQAVGRLAAGGPDFQIEKNYCRKDGSLLSAQSNITAMCSPAGEFLGLIAVVLDISERLRAEADLHEREHFLQRMTTVTPGVLHVFDIEKQISVFVSRSVASVIGYTAEEIAAMGSEVIPTLMHPDDQPRFAQHIERMRTLGNDESLDFEHRMRAKSGEWRWYQNRDAVFARDNEGAVREIVGATLDITERKRTEETMARLAAIVESSHDALFGEDLDGIVTSWNAGAGEIFGYSAAEMVGTSIMRLIPEDRRAAERELQRNVVAGERGGTFESVRQTKNGRVFPASITVSPLKDAAGKVIGTSRAVRDVTERKRAEERLRESEEFSRAVLQSSPDCVKVLDGDGVLLLLNEPGLCLLEIDDPTAVIGKHWRDLWPEEARAEVQSAIERAQRGEVCRFEQFCPTAKGTPKWWDVQVSPVRNADGSIHRVVAVSRDMTERRKIEEQLRLYELVVLNVLDAVMITEAEPLDLPGPRILYVNPAFTKMTGYTAEEVLGKTPRILQGPKTDRPALDTIRANLKRWKPTRVELTNYRKDGTEFDVELEIVPVADQTGWIKHWVAVQHDVTERKRAEESLRANEQRMRLATEATQVGIWEWNVVTGQIRWDAQMFRLYGVAPTEDGFVNYETWRRAVLPEELARQEEVLQDTLQRGGQSTREFRILRANDGECRWIQAVETVRMGSEGKAEWVVGTNLDITEREHAADKLREAKEAAEAANRSKDRFLAVLSHELRTPLTPALMTVAALEHDPGLRADIREDMSMIRRNIEMETKLIDDLLDVNRIVSGKLELRLEPLDLNAAVLHAHSICRPQSLEQELQITVELCKDAGFIIADPARFQQVIWNVLKNAVKFTPRNGKIHISSKRLSDTRVEIRVTDNGAGIPADILPRIFDAFEQGDTRITRQFGGLGLGLAISKALIELHGGSIRAESQGGGKGATFIIEVPGTPLEAPAVDEPAEPHILKTTALRLLVVEDHADTARALKTLLAREGFLVTTAGTVANALATAKAHTFDILVSDLGLPDASGCELMRSIKDVQPLPGIAMSGYGMEEDVRQSREAGFSDHLVKPIKIPQLMASIQRLLAARTKSTE